MKLTYIFEICHHENRKTWPKWDVIDSEKDFFFVEIFQNKKDEVWKNTTGKISWNTSDNNEEMQFSVLTGYREILNHGKKHFLQNFWKKLFGGNARRY